MMLRYIVAILIGLLLGPSAFAEWVVQHQNPDGSWESSYRKSTEESARAFAGPVCMRKAAPLKIVDTVSGKETALYCDPRTRKITADGKPTPVTLLPEAEADTEAERIKKLCDFNGLLNGVADCNCVRDKAKAELLQHEAIPISSVVIRKVGPLCVERSRTYDWTYAQCISAMKGLTDLEQFCRCTADATATGFTSKPEINLAEYEGARNAAMRQCKVNN